MSTPQLLLVIFVGAAVLLLLTVAVLFVNRWMKAAFPDPVRTPVQSVPVSDGKPSETWWDALHGMQSDFLSLQTEVKSALATSENSLRLARGSEERARKLRVERGYEAEEEDEPPAQPQRDWDEAPTPPAVATSRGFEHVRAQLEARRAKS